jgi:hypothetical protein
MKHPRAIDAFEVELRRAKEYLDEYADRPERWVCVRLLRRILKTGFAALHEFDQVEPLIEPPQEGAK